MSPMELRILSSGCLGRRLRCFGDAYWVECFDIPETLHTSRIAIQQPQCSSIFSNDIGNLPENTQAYGIDSLDDLMLLLYKKSNDARATFFIPCAVANSGTEYLRENIRTHE